jgi:voltage-gated potassium channel
VTPWRRLVIALSALALVVVVGTTGYFLFGLGFLDALYQTVTTMTTVGFRELGDFGTGEKLFTIGLILVGVSITLYGLTAAVEIVLEGQLRGHFGRRRMDRSIAAMHDHVVVCGWGRVGRTICRELQDAGREFVVVDIDAARLADCPHQWVAGDATHDDTLRAAGIERAQALVAALSTDAENLFITLSGRSLKPSLFVVARARAEESLPKLTRAGADRVVNPQELGGARIAAFLARPNVAEFIDVVMHERSMEFRMEEVVVGAASPIAGFTLRDAHLRDRTGTLVLAIRRTDGTFSTNPSADARLDVGQVVIAVGTADGLAALEALVNPPVSSLPTPPGPASTGSAAPPADPDRTPGAGTSAPTAI